MEFLIILNGFSFFNSKITVNNSLQKTKNTYDFWAEIFNYLFCHKYLQTKLFPII